MKYCCFAALAIWLVPNVRSADEFSCMMGVLTNAKLISHPLSTTLLPVGPGNFCIDIQLLYGTPHCEYIFSFSRSFGK